MISVLLVLIRIWILSCHVNVTGHSDKQTYRKQRKREDYTVTGASLFSFLQFHCNHDNTKVLLK